MSNYSLMNLILICSIFFLALFTLFLLFRRTKEKRTIIKAIENNNAAYEDQFVNEEELLRKTLGSDLGAKLDNIITEIITVEKDSYKKLCTVFIDHHSEAIELLPFTMNQITTAYIRCLSQVILSLKDKKEVETVSLQDNKTEEEQLSQYEALIEQLRSEKQNYSNRYKEISNLLDEIYLKYKEKLELNTVDSLQTKNLNEIAALFKLKSVIFEDTENDNELVPIEETENNNESIPIEEAKKDNELVPIEDAEKKE